MSTTGPLLFVLNVHDSQCLHAAAEKDKSKPCIFRCAGTTCCLIIDTIGQPDGVARLFVVGPNICTIPLRPVRMHLSQRLRPSSYRPADLWPPSNKCSSDPAGFHNRGSAARGFFSTLAPYRMENVNKITKFLLPHFINGRNQ